jgi:hypothetical protein
MPSEAHNSFMESASPAYRISIKSSGIVVADNLPRSAPAIQLQEGKPVVGHLHPTLLEPGDATFVVYPLESKASITCRVQRIDGLQEDALNAKPPEQPAEEPKIETVSVRRGRGKRMST